MTPRRQASTVNFLLRPESVTSSTPIKTLNHLSCPLGKVGEGKQAPLFFIGIYESRVYHRAIPRPGYTRSFRVPWAAAMQALIKLRSFLCQLGCSTQGLLFFSLSLSLPLIWSLRAIFMEPMNAGPYTYNYVRYTPSFQLYSQYQTSCRTYVSDRSDIGRSPGIDIRDTRGYVLYCFRYPPAGPTEGLYSKKFYSRSGLIVDMRLEDRNHPLLNTLDN